MTGEREVRIRRHFGAPPDVIFEEDEGGTTVTITAGPHTDEMYPNALAGWTQSLDKLQSLLDA